MAATIIEFKDINKKNSSDVIGVAEIPIDDFFQLTIIFKVSLIIRHLEGGRTSKLCIEDMLLAAFQYNPRTITYKQLAKKFKVNESNMYRTIKWVKEGLEEMDLIFPAPTIKLNINKLHRNVKNLKESVSGHIS